MPLVTGEALGQQWLSKRVARGVIPVDNKRKKLFKQEIIEQIVKQAGIQESEELLEAIEQYQRMLKSQEARLVVEIYELEEGEKLITVEQQPQIAYINKEITLALPPNPREISLIIDDKGLLSSQMGSSNLLIVRYDREMGEQTLIILDDPSTPPILYDYINNKFMPDLFKAFRLNLTNGLHIDRVETICVKYYEFKQMLKQDGMVKEMIMVHKTDINNIRRVKEVNVDGKTYEIKGTKVAESMQRHMMHLFQ
ncbi:hypothetical protein FGO68_gene12193 [Halteria grandinella]|uniref:Uncharacterized protein n=1 Tax=Halteria grandinella TaxID=5974 RepID=A0A8J8NYW9_HALGN|nr:hypothetical protein FGO68_gene12193 [Halteria grandinella]